MMSKASILIGGSNVSDNIQLNTKSSAQLSEEVRNILDQEIPDPSGGIASVLPILGSKEYVAARKRHTP